MNKIATYTVAKDALERSHAWAEMLGKTYYGGTRGKGAVGRIVYCSLSREQLKVPTIYYQHSDGDKNYHDCPEALLGFLEKATEARFPEILATALQLQEEAVRAAAAEAVTEHQALLVAAGLSERPVESVLEAPAA